MSDEFEKKQELEDRTIEALLLGFKNPIYEDYNIPRAHEIEQAVGCSLADLCGMDKDKKEMILNGGICWDLHHPERLQERVRQGLQDIFSGYRDEQNSLDMYMKTLHKLDWIWVYMLGDIFKFKDGDREKAEERVKAYWNAEELRNFQDINEGVRIIIDREYAEKQKRPGVGNCVVR